RKRCLAGTLIKFRLSNVDDLTLGRTTTIHQLLSRGVHPVNQHRDQSGYDYHDSSFQPSHESRF
ncbi:hypothetical protein, partial [Agrobacterium sp. DSM 25558]|uniref:hypothetical protein n=1 Tax=Agrobacterium sp. DSM 25558 TaxID=1907665 RepID=UPI001AECAC12